jgi:cysteine desulfurase family protein (TIGR01976 family)
MTATSTQSTGPIASVDAIRAQFPALARRHGAHAVAYFDGPGGTQVPQRVADASTEYLFHHNANTHWAYPTSAETDAALAHAREVFAAFFNASADEVVFGANMTTLTFHVSRAIARTLAPRDEVVVTELDHHGNVDPWREAARDHGLLVKTVRMNPLTGQLDWDHFAACVGPRTRVIAIGAASNALGTVNNLARARELAVAVDALLFVDAVHYAPHELPDVKAMGCDFLACSAYKFYGPHIGVLYGRRDVLQTLPFPRLIPQSDASPERAETGTLNHEGIVGAAAAVEWLASLSGSDLSPLRGRLEITYRGLHERGYRQVARLWSELKKVRGVTLYGPDPSQPRTPTIAFTVAGHTPTRIAGALAQQQAVFVSDGDFYAHTVVERLGLAPTGLVRAGSACYTTDEELDRLIGGVRQLANG